MTEHDGGAAFDPRALEFELPVSLAPKPKSIERLQRNVGVLISRGTVVTYRECALKNRKGFVSGRGRDNFVHVVQQAAGGVGESPHYRTMVTWYDGTHRLPIDQYMVQDGIVLGYARLISEASGAVTALYDGYGETTETSYTEKLETELAQLQGRAGSHRPPLIDSLEKLLSKHGAISRQYDAVGWVRREANKSDNKIGARIVERRQPTKALRVLPKLRLELTLGDDDTYPVRRSVHILENDKIEYDDIYLVPGMGDHSDQEGKMSDEERYKSMAQIMKAALRKGMYAASRQDIKRINCLLSDMLVRIAWTPSSTAG